MHMSDAVMAFRTGAEKADRERNDATTHPEGVRCVKDLPYGPCGQWHLLNVYYPEDGEELLPVIVSVHGGGYVYGTKEVYHHYCADLARRGFAVVNFNYRLAPESPFPAQLEDINSVMDWVAQNNGNYRMDIKRLFLLGDSAGAQLASQYGAMLTNAAYAGLFSFPIAPVTVRGLGLNCGMYDLPAKLRSPSFRLGKDYLGKTTALNDPRLEVFGAVTEGYPPAHITTACFDFNRTGAQPFAQLLHAKGIPAVCECYGAEDRPDIAHVFHVDIRLPEAKACNDAQCAFFRSLLPK